jgi:hypothetical protein
MAPEQEERFVMTHGKSRSASAWKKGRTILGQKDTWNSTSMKKTRL